jgi:imidazolonepropionase-like amidohydrolase
LTELRLKQYDELVIAIRVSRLFTGEKFTEGPATVLLDHGQIVAVETGRVELDESWDIAEYESATVLPGLIDTHVHLVADSKIGALDRVPTLSDQELDAVITDGLRRQLAAGVTTVRDLGDRHYAVVARRDVQRAGRTSEPEPTIVASGPPLTTVGGHCDYLGGEVGTSRQISTAIRERVEREVDVIKVMASGGMMSPKSDVMRTQFTDADMRSIVEQAHAAGLSVTAHAHGLPAVEQSVDARVDCIEHCSCMTDKGLQVSEKLVATIADRDIAVSGVLPPNPHMDLTKAPPALHKLIAATGLTPQRIWELTADMIHRLHSNGARIVTGIDAGLGPWVAHGNLYRGLSLLEDAGFSTAEALAAATSQAARVCGLEHQKGWLRKGYDADLVVVDGDLQTNLSGLQHLLLVVLGGRPVSGQRIAG